ncbi:MAG: T9SS type A sorting domain-containing protein, partial [Bacteroidales bacterium]|nr:T9SS type A sorting domain-containing protein [Bacteroidales bacterium]
DGTNITFTPTPVNGGTPAYQWKLNGVNVGTGATYSSAMLNDNDNITVEMTSSLTCVSGNPATSNTVNMIINPILNAEVSIVADITTICLGSTVTFTATPVNGGTPSYAWYVNNVNLGAADTNSFSSNTLTDGDNVHCVMTSSEICVTNSPATSNSVGITVNSALPVTVIVSPDANPICDGSNVTFTAVPTNGGATPVYDWLVNGISVSAPNVNTYSSNLLVNGDDVSVILNSSEPCATGNPATSNEVTMVVNPNLAVDVSITPDDNDVCDGTTVTFTANPTNGGATPSYDWLVNGISVGAVNSNTYSSNILNDSDDVSVVLTSSEACVTGNPATSNTVNMIINPILNAEVSIVADITTICLGSTVTFTATPVNGGTPSYTWFVNNVNIGAPDANTFSSNTLADGDDIHCIMTSSETCVTNSPATSNSVEINVNPIPTVPIVDVQCIGTNGAGVVAITDPIGAEYTYSIDGIAFQSEPLFSDVANGDYTITVDQAGCINTSVVFSVDCTCDDPATLTVSTTDGIACNNTNYVLSGNTFGGNATEVTVSHNGNGNLEQSVFTTSPFEIVYIQDAADLNTDITFTVTTDDPTGELCNGVSDQFVITVHESPVVDLPETENACEGEDYTYLLTETYDYVLWMDAIEEQNFTENYTLSGNYEVWVYVENEFCSDTDTMTIVVTVCSDIDQALNNGRFKIYPNPTRENCQLSIDNYKGELSYSLLDIQGKIIISKDLDIKSDLIEDITIEDLVPGMYFIRLTTESETINYKLIKN